MPKLDDSVCVVVPVYNASGTLRALTEQLIDVLSAFKSWQIVLVDDSSTDSSADIIRDLCIYDNISAVLLAQNAGQQSAVFCGLGMSTCDYTVIIDDDLEQSPSDIMALYNEITRGYDVVYGISDTPPQKGVLRRIGSALRDRLFDAVTHKPKDMKVCSFRIINRKTVDNVLLADTEFVYVSMEILQHTRNIQNIAVTSGAAAPSGYRLFHLMVLLFKMYVYYAPKTIFARYRKKGACYSIKETISAKDKR